MTPDLLTGRSRALTDVGHRSPHGDPLATSSPAPVEVASYVDVDGRCLHSRSWSPPAPSDAVPVVMVHGLGVASRMCRPTARRLALKRTVHAPDLPGFGRSEPGSTTFGPVEHAEALDRWVERIGMSSAVLIGTSLGAQVAAELAVRRPEWCTAVVLASPTVDAADRRWSTQLRHWSREARTHSWPFRRLMAADYLRCGPIRPAATFDRAMRHPVELTVSDIEAPVLVCRGTRDPLVSDRWAAELTRACGDGTLRIMPGATHAMCHDSAVELARVVEYHLDADPPTGAATVEEHRP